MNGVSPLASTGVGIGWVGWLIGILAIIGGALGITVAVRKPKGKATDETRKPMTAKRHPISRETPDPIEGLEGDANIPPNPTLNLDAMRDPPANRLL